MSAVFPKEVCVAETNTIVNCIGWDPEKGYRMRGDDKKIFYLKTNEFTLLSGKNEPLWQSDADGNITPEREAAMIAVVQTVRPQSGTGRSPRSGSGSRRSGRLDPERKREAAERVNAIFDGVKGRENIAEAGAPHLDTTPAELLAQYEHLDNGRFSMTVRNRMRSIFAQGE